MNIYLFRKYWSKHKRRLFSLILSIIMLTATAVFSVLNQRTELRRKLHSLYDENGNYSVAVLNVSDKQGKEITKLSDIESIGKISVCGKSEIAGEKYTVGSFDDEAAEWLYHTPMEKGELPHKKGQIAVPEFILDQLYTSVEVGDTISLEYRTPEGEAVSREYELSGIIRNYINRYDMEYTCSFDNITVTRNQIDYPTPSIYIHKDDNTSPCYTNYLIGCNDKIFFSNEGSGKHSDMLNKLWDISNNVVSGKQYFVLNTMTKIRFFKDGFLYTKKTDDMRVIGLMTVLMMIVAAIAMFSGVISIMPQRVESLRLLRSIGASKRRLIFMFVTEFALFFVIGVSLGIVSACGLHELLIHLQKMLGISAYRGYTAEYIIEQKTSSPFVFPIVLSFVIALISLIVPLKNIITMTFYKRPNIQRSNRKVNSITSAYNKITGNRLLSVLSALSIVIVICSTAFGYCYYTRTDKGTSWFTVGNENAEASYYKVRGFDLKENNIDCAVTANIPRCAGVAVYDKQYGISAEEEKRLYETADLLAYGFYQADVILYPDGQEAPPQIARNTSKYNEDWEFYDEFSSNTMYTIPMLLLNDSMMGMLGCDESDIVLVSKNDDFAYQIGDTIPMSTCLCDETIHVWLDTQKLIEANVTKTVDIRQFDTEQNTLLLNTGVFNFIEPCAIAMTAQKAEQLGFYHPGYSTALLRFDEDPSDKEMREKVSSATDKPFVTVTLPELKHNAKINKLSSNANSIILFVLLFVLCFISIWNLLSMNAQNSIEKFTVMHSIGMPLKRIKKLFISCMIKTAIISILLGAVISFAGQSLVAAKYDKYTELFTEQQQIMGNENFPVSWFEMPLEAIDESDELYPVTKKMEELKSAYMLEKELWLPKLTVPLLIISMVIFLSSLICAAVTARRLMIERSFSNDKGR